MVFRLLISTGTKTKGVSLVRNAIRFCSQGSHVDQRKVGIIGVPFYKVKLTLQINILKVWTKTVPLKFRPDL